MAIRVLVSKVFEVSSVGDVKEFLDRGWSVYTESIADQKPSPAATDHAKTVSWLREKCGLTFEQLAALFSVTAPTAYQWSVGRARPDARHWESITALRKQIECGEIKPRQVKAKAKSLAKSRLRDLSDDEKLEIAWLRQSGAPVREIAEKYNVLFCRVSEIVSEVVG